MPRRRTWQQIGCVSANEGTPDWARGVLSTARGGRERGCVFRCRGFAFWMLLGCHYFWLGKARPTSNTRVAPSCSQSSAPRVSTTPRHPHASPKRARSRPTPPSLLIACRVLLQLGISCPRVAIHHHYAQSCHAVDLLTPPDSTTTVTPR
jgi:hypothetical protein